MSEIASPQYLVVRGEKAVTIMAGYHDLRRGYLISIGHMIVTYLQEGHHLHLRTLLDGEDFAGVAKCWDGAPAIVFTIDDWEAFVDIMEPATARGSLE